MDPADGTWHEILSSRAEYLIYLYAAITQSVSLRTPSYQRRAEVVLNDCIYPWYTDGEAIYVEANWQLTKF